jgi:septal ring factor EnvC (AmiA/AmiB activator)
VLAPASAVRTQEPAAVGAPADLAARTGEFETVSREIGLSAERIDRLAAEIATVKKDSASITAAMIQAAKTDRKLAEDIEAIGARLDVLQGREDVIRKSLSARRAVLAEVLGALQRMGLNPPPAILVKPEDALSSVRSAILLGAVVPGLRAETEVLMADMTELSRIVGSAREERARLAAAMEDQAEQKRRLSMLLDIKRRVQSQTEAALAAERDRAAELAGQARSLKDLIAALEKDAARTRVEADAARAARDRTLSREAEMAALPENNRSIDALPFTALRNQIALPVSGRIGLHFGGRDDNGAVMLGDTVATQSGAIVTAPADGNVLYAGPFRSYGQLLILDVGDGYHVVLAGMSRISVALGRSVLAGEPVGVMGEARLASVSAGRLSEGPELYVEFRKDGKPVDPAPWWAERRSGRTGNDT